MRYRRNNKKFAGGFASFSWWASAGTGGVVFILMYWVLPALMAGNGILSAYGRMSRSFAWLPLLVFGTVALFGLAKSVFVDESSKSRRERRQSEKSWRNTSVNISRLMVNHGWGVTRQRPVKAAKPKAPVFDKWTLEALRVLEWKRFELLCAAYFQSAGFQSKTIRCGADAFDIRLFKSDPAKPVAAVQCKTGNVYTVGVKELRDLLSLMSREKVARGIFISTGTFNRDALTFAGDHQIQLLDGDAFLRKIQALPQEQRDELLKDAFEGDYTTPTCPSCDVKMTRREGEGKPLWRCVNHPRCANTFPLNR